MRRKKISVLVIAIILIVYFLPLISPPSLASNQEETVNFDVTFHGGEWSSERLGDISWKRAYFMDLTIEHDHNETLTIYVWGTITMSSGETTESSGGAEISSPGEPLPEDYQGGVYDVEVEIEPNEAQTVMLYFPPSAQDDNVVDHDYDISFDSRSVKLDVDDDDDGISLTNFCLAIIVIGVLVFFIIIYFYEKCPNCGEFTSKYREKCGHCGYYINKNKEDSSDFTTPSSDDYDVDRDDYGIDYEERDADRDQSGFYEKDEDDEVEPFDVDWD